MPSRRPSPLSGFLVLLVLPGLLAGLPALAQPAFRVADLNPANPQSWSLSLETGRRIAVLGNALVFVADDGGEYGAELWRSDGTSAGTRLLKDICPGACSSSPTSLTVSNGTPVLHRGRRGSWTGAVEVGRHPRGHVDGGGDPAGALGLDQRPHRRERRALLLRRRRRARVRAVDVGRHPGRHPPGQGHRPGAGLDQRPLPGHLRPQAAVRGRLRSPADGALGERRHRGGDRDGGGHPAGRGCHLARLRSPRLRAGRGPGSPGRLPVRRRRRHGDGALVHRRDSRRHHGPASREPPPRTR